MSFQFNTYPSRPCFISCLKEHSQGKPVLEEVEKINLRVDGCDYKIPLKDAQASQSYFR